ncbi:N-terminal acetyltransferase A complex auxiliary subunit NAA15-like isoform X3 [Lotus japonicus]|uniref:N-terminal acetyltransferase A complex auxiliary subunit NAA15-like isoform X3 n=1 Tax=Lotus japonicus TaxID=34305 RepID=UPI002589BA30|nr:N-terminal acetyltransferase A complex auxiliary subunit NAA15-like isoform X3 [Lotus japonicus]
MIFLLFQKKKGWLECAGLESLLLPIMCFSLLVSGDGVKIDEEMSNLLPSQKRKIRQKQRKAEARAKKGAEEKNEELSVSEVFKSRKRHVKPMNLDPHGEKLLQWGC